MENPPDHPQPPASVEMTKSASGKVSFLEVDPKVRFQHTDKLLGDQVDFISLTNPRGWPRLASLSIGTRTRGKANTEAFQALSKSG